MGAGAGAAKKQKYNASPELVDDQPGFDHDAWRTPKIRGQVQPLSERRDIASSWSPRQGGKSVTLMAEKPKTALSETRPTRPLGSPTATGMGLLSSFNAEGKGVESESLGATKSAGPAEYVPALGDEPELKKAGSCQSLDGPDPAALQEEMELMWKKLLAKRQGASANMGALFKARQLKDDVDEAAKTTSETQQKKALAASKVASRVHSIEDACHVLEKKALKNIGVSALWRRGDLAVRTGGQGLCEILVNTKSEMEVRMCISGASLTLERNQLVPLARKEMEDFRKLLSEMEAAKAEEARLADAVTQCSDQLRQKHEKLVEQIELELEELEKDPEFAPAGTVPQNMELVIGWNGVYQPPSQEAGQTPGPSFPQMAGLISAAEMMMKAQAEQKAAEKRRASEASEASDWVEEKTEEGETIFRNQKTGETASERPVAKAAAKASAPFGSAASPTVPAGARPPWAKAPPKPKDCIWREPGLAMPKSKAPPPMPKTPAVLTRLAQAKEAGLQETGLHSKSLGPSAKVIPAPPAQATPRQPVTGGAAGPGAKGQGASETPGDGKAVAAAEAVPMTYWTEVQTEEGDIYYHNEETDETAWELPPGGQVKKPEAEESQSGPQIEQSQWQDVPSPVPAALKCPLCEDYLDQAVLAVCCGANFCHRCAHAAMAEAPRPNACPKCQVEGIQLVPNEDLRRRVQQAFPVSYWSPVNTEDGQVYYYNVETGETAWELPRGGQVHTEGQQPQAGEVFGDWVSCQTAEGHIYYYNQQTGETSWELPSVHAAQPAAMGAENPLNPFAQAEEAARMQRQQYEDALRQMQQAEEQARQQREQWDQIYAQHFAWYQQQQQQQAQAAAQQAQAAAGSTGPSPEGAAAGLVPPSLHATMEEQIAFAMKCSVVQEMEEMIKRGASVADRKKALKAWQIKWHPDKNPDQVEVAKSLFQFLAEKKNWFCQDPDADGNWEDIPVDAVD